MIINMNLGASGYEIIVEHDILKKVGEFINLNRKVLIVTDSGVPTEYSKAVAAQCKYPTIITVPGGEDSKSFDKLQMLCGEMLKHNFTRKDCVVAVGGGVVGDLSGFAAACFMRGIDFYNIPTTFLSQVDSSIGGKVAVNFNGIKNIIGAFYQPKCVIIDPEVLKTLSERQISNGMAESVKMALTSDKELFEIFKSDDYKNNIDEIIVRSLNIKKSVVEQDEKETGLRKILNFGHTVGHAIESLNFGKLYHGECVGIGMLYMCSDDVKSQLISVLKRLNLPTKAEYSENEILNSLMHDKKSENNGVSVVYVPKIGSYEIKKMSFEEIGKLL